MLPLARWRTSDGEVWVPVLTGILSVGAGA